MDFQNIGAAIREARKALGASQAEIAHDLKMSRATISGIENGTVTEIGTRKLMALCAAVGLGLEVAPRRRPPNLAELREEHRATRTRP